MKPNLIKKQISQAIVKNKINLENFQIILSNLQTKKDKTILDNTVIKDKNLILEKVTKTNQNFLQKNKISKAIIKQNNRDNVNKKNFAIGSTNLHLYKNQNMITTFLEQESKNYSSLSFAKINNFILQMPQDDITLWFFTVTKIKASLINVSLIPVKTLLKLESSRSFFEKKNDIETNNS